MTPHILETKPVGKLLLQYSIPAIIGMTVVSLYHIVDSIFIGQGVGPLAISGLAITFPLMNLVMALCTLVGVGGATISSIYLGQKDQDRVVQTLHHVLILSVISGVGFGAIALLFLDPILLLFGASDTTLPYAREFMQIILLGNPFFFVFLGLNNVMRATGYPKKAMISSLLTVGINIALAPVFIFGFKWGIRGAAIATIIAQFTGMIWVLVHFLNKNSLVRFQSGFFRLNGSIVRHILGIGMSPFLINACSCVVVVFVNNSFRNYGGDLTIGAYGIVNRVLMLFVMIVLGLNQGMQPIIGYNYGAGRWDRVKSTFRCAVITGGVVMTFGFLVCEIFPQTIVAMFTDDEVLKGLAKNGLQITCLMSALVGCQIVISNFFQSLGKARISIFLSLSRQLLFLIPLLIFLPRHFGVDGVWYSMPLSDLIAFVVSIVTLSWYFNKVSLRETAEARFTCNDNNLLETPGR